MDTVTLLVAVTAGFCFAVWPILGRYSGATGAWVGTIAGVASTIAIIVGSYSRLKTGEMPSAKALAIISFAGLINGAGVCLYVVKTSDAQMRAGAFMVLTSISVSVLAPLLDWAVNRASPSPRQFVGFVFAAVAIYFLRK